METMLAFVIGGLYTAGIYSMLRRSLVKIVLGLMFISHATNLLIFTAGGLTRAKPPLIENAKSALDASYADPLPQALILTAIVISFGVTAFTLVLLHKVYERVGSDDVDDIRERSKT